MAYGIVPNSSLPNQTVARPNITTFDSGYEHSFDHYVDLKLLVQQEEKEASDTPATLAAAH